MPTKVEPFYVELGARIALARVVRGMTQQALGKALVPPQTRAGIANIENAKQRVLSHTLVQIAHALGIELWDIVPRRKP